MKLGVLTVPLQAMPAEEAFAYLSSIGIEAVEIGTGGYTNDSHLKPSEYLGNPAKIEEYKAMLKKYNLEISALSCHGNPVHPNKEIAEGYHNVFVDTCRLAQMLGVDTVITFSGCPGDCEESKRPNWVTCAWPNEYGEILEWQWNEVLIPYWKKAAEIAKSYGVKKIAFEMHPGFCVYNPETLLRLRKAVGDIIGANFDPSHLFWQGIDPILAVRHLGPAIFHVHAKDTMMDPVSARIVGVLDTTPYDQVMRRSWIFRSVGYGHDNKFWKDFVAALRTVGYDYVLSIEHEDILFSSEEGFQKAVATLKEAIAVGPLPKVWWA